MRQLRGKASKEQQRSNVLAVGKAWHFCAAQGERCYCPGRARWGNNQTWVGVEPDGDAVAIHCTVESLGDPVVGDVHKHCECDEGKDAQEGLLRGVEPRTHRFHDNDGWPLINKAKFPNMTAMNSKAHQLGLTTGFYLNNCLCRETSKATHQMYQHDVDTTVSLGFDAVKIDACGTQMDLELYGSLYNASGRPVMIENCHWGDTVPTSDWCPFSYFRTSQDIIGTYDSAVRNLQTTIKWANEGLSRPGCWAYPDMLEVGVQKGANGKVDAGLSFAESRSHFGAWCIVSSPLILSMDLANTTIMNRYWPIIANKEAIRINQAWAGHSGSPFKQANTTVHLVRALGGPGSGTHGPLDVPAWQYFYKPLGDGETAVLLMNHGDRTETLDLDFADVPGLSCTTCDVRDVWKHEDLGQHQDRFSVARLPSHDSVFLILKPR